MPIRIVKCKIVGIKREGKAVEPTINAKFNFTADEVAEIDLANPDALVKPVGDAEEEPATPKLTKAEAKAKADEEKAAAKEKADAEAAAGGETGGDAGSETGAESGTGEVL